MVILGNLGEIFKIITINFYFYKRSYGIRTNLLNYYKNDVTIKIF